MSILDKSKLNTQNSKLTLVAGKGGVGKTTVAAALAIARADEGDRVLAVSVDPAHSLGDVLGVRLGAEPVAVPGLSSLIALELDAEAERQRFLESHRGTLLSLLERGTYLDASDAAGLVDLTVPGVDELAALFRLQDLLSRGDPLIVDTAPTGHTLRLLDLPELARAWLHALQAMEDRSRAVSTALVGAYRPDEATALLQQLTAEVTELSHLLRDPQDTRVILVTGREPVVLAETLRYQEALAGRRISVGGVVVNRSSVGEVRGSAGVPMTFVPPLAQPPVGVPALREFARYLSGEGVPDSTSPESRTVRVRRGNPYTPPLDRSLYLVGGKGGVGKSTAAAALAVRLSEEERHVLLLGIDPAGSLGDVLGVPVSPGEGATRLSDHLSARELDAEAAWESFRGRYRTEAERIFGGLLSSTGSGADGAVVSRLIDLAPPGMDELAALVEVIDATEDRPYDALVVDTAPTGHFLRLLELPELALRWTHQVMRVLLKYREVVAPGDLAEHLLELARSLREFQQRLRDRGQSWLLVVSLPESLSLSESGRLFTRLKELTLPPGGLLINRLPRAEGQPELASDLMVELRRLARGVPTFAAPVLSTGPRGLAELSAFSRSWEEVQLNVQESAV